MGVPRRRHGTGLHTRQILTESRQLQSVRSFLAWRSAVPTPTAA
ncbi:hypothetical protein [Micromonospora sp. NPDC023888]